MLKDCNFLAATFFLILLQSRNAPTPTRATSATEPMEAPTATPTPTEEELPESEDAVNAVVAETPVVPTAAAVVVLEEDEDIAGARTFMPLIGIPYTVIAAS